MFSPRIHSARASRPGPNIDRRSQPAHRSKEAPIINLNPRLGIPLPADLKVPAFDFARIGIHAPQSGLNSVIRDTPKQPLASVVLHSPITETQLEREAEDAAAQVTADPPSHLPAQTAPPRLSHSSASRERTPVVLPPRSGGRPLDPAILADFEVGFGSPLSQTRVHTGQEATSAARNLDALAYTFGDHIVFGDGQFAPHTSTGRKLLAHELAHVVQQSHLPPVIQRKPKKKTSAPPKRTFPQFQIADQVLDLTRDPNDDWEIVVSGYITEESALHAIWPSQVPASVTIRLLVVVTEPVEQAKFKLSGITFQSLSTMDPSVARLFTAHGLEDETKERPDLVKARAAFREYHSGLGESVLDGMDVALKKVTKHNSDLLVAYYRYYAAHELSSADLGGDAGDTSGGDTKINEDLLRREPKADFPTNDPISLLAGTLIHEYAHTPHGPKQLGVDYVPKEAKAYAVERFFADRMGDTKRVRFIEKRYSGTDPWDMALSGNEIFDRTDRILTALYKIIDGRGPEAEKARQMSVDFISHNEADYGPDLKEFIKKLSM